MPEIQSETIFSSSWLMRGCCVVRESEADVNKAAVLFLCWGGIVFRRRLRSYSESLSVILEESRESCSFIHVFLPLR